MTETVFTIRGVNELGYNVTRQTTDAKRARLIYDSWVTAADIRDVTVEPEPPELKSKFEPGDRVYVQPDRYDDSARHGWATIIKTIENDFILVQYDQDLVLADRVSRIAR